MDEVYSEVASRVNAMGYSSIAPSLKSLSDQQLNDVFGFLFQKYDSNLWNGKDKSNANVARVMNRMGLGHMIKDGKMVSTQNKKIPLALNAVIEKLILKLGEDEVFNRGGANKRQPKHIENKENNDPITPAHNKVLQLEYQFDTVADKDDVFSRKAKVVRTPAKSDLPNQATQNGAEDDAAIFGKRAKVMRTPVQPQKAETAYEFGQPAGANLQPADREVAFSRQSKLARTPVHPSTSTEDAGGDIFSRQSKLARTPVHPTTTANEAGGDVFARQSKVARTPVQPSMDDDVFARQSKLARTPVQPSMDDAGDVFSRQSKLARTPVNPAAVHAAPVQNQDSDAGDVFSRQSKLARTPVNPAAHVQNQESGAEVFTRQSKLARTPVLSAPPPPSTHNQEDAGPNVFSRQSKLARTPVHHPAAPVAPTAPVQPDEDSLDGKVEVFSRQSKLARTPVAPNRDEAFSKSSRVLRTPAGQMIDQVTFPEMEESVAQPSKAERQNVFQKKSKLARTPPNPNSHSANLPTQDVEESAKVFASKSSLMRSPVEPPAQATNLEMNPPKPRNQKNQTGYTEVFGAKSKLARTPNNQPPPQAINDEDEITISKFDHLEKEMQREMEKEMEKEKKKLREMELERERKDRERKEQERKEREREERETKEREEKHKAAEREGRKREDTKSDVFGAKAKVLRSPIPVPSFPESTNSQSTTTKPSTPSKRTTTPKKTPNKKNPTPIAKWNSSTVITNSPGPNQLTKRTPNRQPAAASASVSSNGFPESPSRSYGSAVSASPARARAASAPSAPASHAPAFSSPARTVRRSVIPTTPPPSGIPFHDMSNLPQGFQTPEKQIFHTILVSPKPTPLRTPISEKTASLITPMKNGILLERSEKRTPLRTPNSTYSPLHKKSKADTRTPSKILDPTIANPSLLHPEPFDFYETTEQDNVPVLQEIRPLSFESNDFVEKPLAKHSVPNMPFGVAEEAYLREREEAQKIEAMKVELEKLNKEIKKANEKKDLTEYQIQKFNDDIAKAGAENEMITTKLQRMGMPNLVSTSPSSLKSELNQLKIQHQKQEAKLKSKQSSKDYDVNLQHVEQEIEDISAKIQSCNDQRESIYSQMGYQKFYLEKTLRDLDEQIHQKIIERESEIRETENARREAERLSYYSRPSSFYPEFSSSVVEPTETEEEVKRRVDMFVARGKMLEIARQSLRNMKKRRMNRRKNAF